MEIASLQERLAQYKAQNLKLDMTRGKPGPEQLDLANDMLTLVNGESFTSPGGTDCRNYGVVDGLPEAKKLFAAFLEVAEDEVIIGGNASLTLMHNAVARAMLHGVPGSEKPWCKLDRVAFLCPVPGYDRHFNVCLDMGIEMIPIEMDERGPNMDEVERLVAGDSAIKGIWCVPRYANPNGVTYADETVDRLAAMKTAASDFRILWDNAYAHHHLTDSPTPLKNILTACKEAGHPDRVLIFGSTSKISFAGAGVSALGASRANIEDTLSHMKMETIGHDKLNQLRHVLFFRDMDGVREHMKKHAAILKPRFDMVQTVLERELGEGGYATWSKPEGGYFVSLDTRPGMAKKVVAMAAEAGVKLTAAGATYPHKNDPNDANIRIAPSLPSVDEIRTAMEIVSLCIIIASHEE